jgi:N-acetylated-alpha-linked acidic dipeptidase
MATERAMTDDGGLPRRPWYRHQIYAPGYYTGYGVKTLPGIREAVEDKPDITVAEQEAARVVAAIDRYTNVINNAAARLQQTLR